MVMVQRLVRTQCGFTVMSYLTQREALDVPLEPLWPLLRLTCDCPEDKKSTTESCSQTWSLYSRWEGLFPAGHVACWLTDSWRPNICLKVCPISRCFLASRYTVCSSYSSFYLSSWTLNLQFYRHSLAHILWSFVGCGNWWIYKAQAKGIRVKQRVKSWSSTGTTSKSLWPSSHLWNRNNGSTFPQSLHRCSKAWRPLINGGDMVGVRWGVGVFQNTQGKLCLVHHCMPGT